MNIPAPDAEYRMLQFFGAITSAICLPARLVLRKEIGKKHLQPFTLLVAVILNAVLFVLGSSMAFTYAAIFRFRGDAMSGGEASAASLLTLIVATSYVLHKIDVHEREAQRINVHWRYSGTPRFIPYSRGLNTYLSDASPVFFGILIHLILGWVLLPAYLLLLGTVAIINDLVTAAMIDHRVEEARGALIEAQLLQDDLLAGGKSAGASALSPDEQLALLRKAASRPITRL